MKTDQLIDLLARQAGPAPRHVVERRIAIAAIVGVLASTALTCATLGVNTALADMGSALAVKLAYVIALMAGAAWQVDRLARPGASDQAATQALLAVVLAMALVAGRAWVRTPSAEPLDQLLGQSWSSCIWRVAALSLPALGAGLWALRGLAPTRPRRAGFAAGLLAGSLGALGYSLYCAELSPMFVLAWYSAGMLVPAALGALLGPRLLRW